MLGQASGNDAVVVADPAAAGPFVLLCDHASNALPPPFADLGLPRAILDSHFAWDPGALAVAVRLAPRLNAPLVRTAVSRLVIDCNRRLDAPDLIPTELEGQPVPGNGGLSTADRQARVRRFHEPFHAAIAKVVEARLARGLPTALVTVHSFTPVLYGRHRPWQVGIIRHRDRRLADLLLQGLRADGGLTVGENEPYGPQDGVYYTLDRHAESRGLACAMVEIRNDELSTDDGQARWADRLAALLKNAAGALLAGQPPTPVGGAAR